MNAQNTENEADKKESCISNALGRLTIGGYGEAVMSRNFYSQHFNRYRDPETYKNDK